MSSALSTHMRKDGHCHTIFSVLDRGVVADAVGDGDGDRDGHAVIAGVVRVESTATKAV